MAGDLAQGMTQQVKSPTGSVFIIARVYAEATAEDYAAVDALQKDFKLVPLSSYGKPYNPPAGTLDPKAPSVKEIVRDVISAMDTQTYFSKLAKSMDVNPPSPEDGPIVAKMAKIGLVPGQPFDLSQLAPNVQKALADVGKTAYALISEEQKKGGKSVNGWMITTRHRRIWHELSFAPGLPLMAGVQTCKRTLSIQVRKRTPMVRCWIARKVTSCISQRVRRHRSTASGRSRCTIKSTTSSEPAQ